VKKELEEKMSKEADKYLKPLGYVIQICPICNKVDVYKGDKHDCKAWIEIKKTNLMKKD